VFTEHTNQIAATVRQRVSAARLVEALEMDSTTLEEPQSTTGELLQRNDVAYQKEKAHAPPYNLKL
jgi:hypothetical protein